MSDEPVPAITIDGVPVICERVNVEIKQEIGDGPLSQETILYRPPLWLLTINWGAGCIGEGPVDWLSVSTVIPDGQGIASMVVKRLDFTGWHPYRRTIECLHDMADGYTLRSVKPEPTPFVKVAEHG